MGTNEASRTQAIVDVIVSGINKGTFLPGERLPSQRDLGELFGVSRTVIREAIKILEGRNIVRSLKGSGIYVCASPDTSADRPEVRGTDTVVALSDIIDLARLVWSEATRLMVLNGSDAEIAALAEMVRSFYRKFSARTTIQQRYIYETTYGLTITQYSHSVILNRIMIQLLEATTAIDYKVVNDHNTYRGILELDQRMVEAMLERDIARAGLWALERDRIITQIITSDPELLSSAYRLNFGISPIPDSKGSPS
jgi:GntR family transcriptional repressor for pyruvate dehydrogenase complex